ncbi:hypothetical protein QNI19_12300 [Cytophagaceae bacterium DM2B3-1]|uniref:Uncharacterized protein n=1 Tax=Xanthocytophaga flava TaxID=3048013 RepID=A0ABT7CL64_9BACT|nr:hypothetical protein [Xanthocytophaga flavus]MDJ1493715.1 hypothetical protein [Xanthocytophaga flavus]
MKTWKTIYLVIGLLLSMVALHAQSNQVTTEKTKRAQLLYAFCRYVKQTPLQQITKQELQTYIQVSDSAWIPTSSKGRLLQATLEMFQKNLQPINLEEFEVTPWLKFSDPAKLPKMVWESEPVQDIFGQPMKTVDHENELEAGRQQLQNTLIAFKKDQVDTPIQYFLFDERTGKITSWILIKQGDLHYFLRF